MNTSIADLLWALDYESDPAPGDATAALGRASTVLSRLSFFGRYAEVSSQRAETVGTLANSATSVAEAWPHRPGRCTDLIGALGDVVGRDEDLLSEADKWQVALSVATLARRWAGVVHESGPAHPAPRLRMLTVSADEVRRLAAQSPPQPAQFERLHRPIASLTSWADGDPAIVCSGAIAALADLLERRGRPPLTVRQILGVCRSAEAVGQAIDRLVVAPEGLQTATVAWRSARESLTSFTDGVADPTAGDNGEVLMLAAKAHQSADRAVSMELTPSGATHLQEAAASLGRVDIGLERDLRHLVSRAIVRPGERPLREDRVAEWLGRTAFLATEGDLRPITRALRSAHAHACGLSPHELSGDGGAGRVQARPALELAGRPEL